MGKLFKFDFFLQKHNTDPYPDTEFVSPYGMSALHNPEHWRQVAVATSDHHGHLGVEVPGQGPPGSSSCLLPGFSSQGTPTGSLPTLARSLNEAGSTPVVLPAATKGSDAAV